MSRRDQARPRADGTTFEPLLLFVAEAAERSLDAFAAHFGPGFLLRFAEAARPAMAQEEDELPVPAGALTDDEVTGDSEMALAPLRKQGRNPYRPIYVGRTRNNDVVLVDPSVSKVHAAVEVDDQGVWRVSDLGSRHGTFVKERRAPTRGGEAGLPLGERCPLRFGAISLTFVPVGEIYELLRSME